MTLKPGKQLPDNIISSDILYYFGLLMLIYVFVPPCVVAIWYMLCSTFTKGLAGL